MQRPISITLVAMAILIGTSLFSTSLRAQSIWLEQSQGKSIAIEILKPNFDDKKGFDIVDFTFPSSGIFLSGRFSLGVNAIFVGEFPFAYANYDIVTVNFITGELVEVSESEMMIGNPYIGVEIRKQDSSVFVEFGLRPPLAPDDKFFAGDIGLSSDFDRLEAFVPDLLTLQGRVNYRQKNVSNVVFRLRGGPTLWINTEDNGGDDTELWLDYSAQVGYEGNQVSLVGGLTGRMLVSEEDFDFGERTFHQLGISASLGLGLVRPGIHFRIPLDDDFLLSNLDFVVGLNLGIQFN